MFPKITLHFAPPPLSAQFIFNLMITREVIKNI